MVSYFAVTIQADVPDPNDVQLSLREALMGANATPALDTIRFSDVIVGTASVLPDAPRFNNHQPPQQRRKRERSTRWSMINKSNNYASEISV